MRVEQMADIVKLVHKKVAAAVKILECPICLECFEDPMVTKCNHLYCRKCISTFLQNKYNVPCPMCKKPTTKRCLHPSTQLPKIVNAVRNLVEAVKIDTGIDATPRKEYSNSQNSSPEASTRPTSLKPNTCGNKNRSNKRRSTSAGQKRRLRRTTDEEGECQNCCKPGELQREFCQEFIAAKKTCKGNTSLKRGLPEEMPDADRSRQSATLDSHSVVSKILDTFSGPPPRKQEEHRIQENRDTAKKDSHNAKESLEFSFKNSTPDRLNDRLEKHLGSSSSCITEDSRMTCSKILSSPDKTPQCSGQQTSTDTNKASEKHTVLHNPSVGATGASSTHWDDIIVIDSSSSADELQNQLNKNELSGERGSPPRQKRHISEPKTPEESQENLHVQSPCNRENKVGVSKVLTDIKNSPKATQATEGTDKDPYLFIPSQPDPKLTMKMKRIKRWRRGGLRKRGPGITINNLIKERAAKLAECSSFVESHPCISLKSDANSGKVTSKQSDSDLASKFGNSAFTPIKSAFDDPLFSEEASDGNAAMEELIAPIIQKIADGSDESDAGVGRGRKETNKTISATGRDLNHSDENRGDSFGFDDNDFQLFVTPAMADIPSDCTKSIMNSSREKKRMSSSRAVVKGRQQKNVKDTELDQAEIENLSKKISEAESFQLEIEDPCNTSKMSRLNITSTAAVLSSDVDEGLQGDDHKIEGNNCRKENDVFDDIDECNKSFGNKNENTSECTPKTVSVQDCLNPLDGPRNPSPCFDKTKNSDEVIQDCGEGTGNPSKDTNDCFDHNETKDSVCSADSDTLFTHETEGFEYPLMHYQCSSTTEAERSRCEGDEKVITTVNTDPNQASYESCEFDLISTIPNDKTVLDSDSLPSEGNRKCSEMGGVGMSQGNADGKLDGIEEGLEHRTISANTPTHTQPFLPEADHETLKIQEEGCPSKPSCKFDTTDLLPHDVVQNGNEVLRKSNNSSCKDKADYSLSEENRIPVTKTENTLQIEATSQHAYNFPEPSKDLALSSAHQNNATSLHTQDIVGSYESLQTINCPSCHCGMVIKVVFSDGKMTVLLPVAASSSSKSGECNAASTTDQATNTDISYAPNHENPSRLSCPAGGKTPPRPYDESQSLVGNKHPSSLSHQPDETSHDGFASNSLNFRNALKLSTFVGQEHSDAMHGNRAGAISEQTCSSNIRCKEGVIDEHDFVAASCDTMDQKDIDAGCGKGIFTLNYPNDCSIGLATESMLDLVPGQDAWSHTAQSICNENQSSIKMDYCSPLMSPVANITRVSETDVQILSEMQPGNNDLTVNDHSEHLEENNCVPSEQDENVLNFQESLGNKCGDEKNREGNDDVDDTHDGLLRLPSPCPGGDQNSLAKSEPGNAITKHMLSKDDLAEASRSTNHGIISSQQPMFDSPDPDIVDTMNVADDIHHSSTLTHKLSQDLLTDSESSESDDPEITFASIPPAAVANSVSSCKDETLLSLKRNGSSSDKDTHSPALECNMSSLPSIRSQHAKQLMDSDDQATVTPDSEEEFFDPFMHSDPPLWKDTDCNHAEAQESAGKETRTDNEFMPAASDNEGCASEETFNTQGECHPTQIRKEIDELRAQIEAVEACLRNALPTSARNDTTNLHRDPCFTKEANGCSLTDTGSYFIISEESEEDEDELFSSAIAPTPP